MRDTLSDPALLDAPDASLNPDAAHHVDRVRRISTWMDEAVGIPGTRVRVGLDGVMGFLLPGAGDAMGGAISVYTMYAAARLGAGPSVLVRMALNVALDALLGLVPFLGDLFDFVFKANRRNRALLDAYVADPRRTRASSRATVWIVFAVLVLILVAVLAGVVWGLSLLAGLLSRLAGGL